MSNIPIKFKHNFPLIGQIFRFGVVGLTATSVHFCTVIFLVQVYALAPLVANIFAFMIAFQVGYFGHRWWTFANTIALHRVAFLKLLIVQVGNLIANESLFYIFLCYHLPYPIALLIVLTILPFFTFAFSKLWVFK